MNFYHNVKYYSLFCPLFGTVEPDMSSHPYDTGKAAFKRRWLLIEGTFVYKMPFWGMAKWPLIGG